MKIIGVFLFSLLTVVGYGQDRFTYVPDNSGNIYFVEPVFEQLIAGNKRQTTFHFRENKYFYKYCRIVRASVPQTALESLSIVDDKRSLISLYIEPNGEITYVSFILLKEDRAFLTDDVLYQLYRNLKQTPVKMPQMGILGKDTIQDIINGKGDGYYGQITFPFLVNNITVSEKHPFWVGRKELLSREQPLVEGQRFPAMILTTIDDEVIEPSFLKNKVVMYNFYHAGDSICLAGIKGLKKLYNQYKRKDEVVFVSITFDDREVVWDFIRTHEWPLKVVSMERGKINRLVGTYPTNMVVDAEGIITLVRSGGFESPFEMKEAIMRDISPVIRQEAARAKQIKRKNRQK